MSVTPMGARQLKQKINEGDTEIIVYLLFIDHQKLDPVVSKMEKVPVLENLYSNKRKKWDLVTVQ
jgi:hypothetical protein